MGFSDFTEGVIGDKRRWREYRARVKALPAPYDAAIAAVEKYLMQVGNIPNDRASFARMFDDLADLFEQAAANATPVRGVVGDDAVEFAETFASNYSDDSWRTKAESRLQAAITALDEDTRS